MGLALAVALDSRIPLLPWRLPVVPHVLDGLDDLVAHNRHRLPGVEPWCISHEGACDPPNDS